MRKICIGVFIVAFLFAGGGCSLLAEEYELQGGIHEGILDLGDWDRADDVINLSGDWEFYWQNLFTYDQINDITAKPDLLAGVPKVWNSYQINSQSLPGFGYATYRVKIKNAPVGQSLAIRMPAVSAAYNLYLNEKLIASNGKVGTDQEHFSPQYRPVVVAFLPPSEDFDLIVQVANFSYARGGIWNPIFMGSAHSIANYDKAIGYKDMGLVGAFLIMALYYLCIYYMRREGISSLYFALLCLLAICLTIIYGDHVINRIFPWAGYSIIVAIDYVATTWAPICLVFLIGELFPEQTSPKVKKLFAIFGVLISLFILLFPIHIYTSLLYPLQAVGLVMAAYAVVCVAMAFAKNKSDSAIIMAGALVAVVGAVHDVLYQNNMISARWGELCSVGFMVFLFLQAFVLARRSSQAFKDAQMLSERLRSLNKLKEDFLANTSHELRTPLNAMISIADGISRGTEGAVNESQKDSLAMIVASGKRLANLINDIMDYSKLKHYDLTMNFEPVNLKRVVESVINVLGRLYKTGKVRMIIDIPDDLPNIYADESRLLQILYNLVDNAVKFTPSGYIKVSAAEAGDTVEIWVEDTGIGIPEDKLETIFGSFEQLESSHTWSNPGTGLGLSITKYLVEAHGGKIWVESQVGIGSKFCFKIPVCLEAGLEKPWAYELAERELAAEYDPSFTEEFPCRHQGDGPHIILVDDNKVNLISLTSILQLDHYSITALTSAQEFFEEFRVTGNVSLVILDVMLPGLSGYEICREIRKRYTVSELPILLLTARTSTQDMVMGMEAGANDYLAKPFDTDELLARVKTLVQLKQSLDKVVASELAFLHAQIKPHFLYNALNTFVSISLYDMDKARNLIIEFGNYLRRSFDFKDLSQLAPLKNEVELVKAYLAIEKARFEERIEVTYDLPEDLEFMIPILLLQPIVENAVIHGILPKDEGGRIEISVKKDEKGLHFMVKDNGIGIEPEETGVPLRGFEGVGLSNIDNRLKKLYGQGLQINSTPNQGTQVTWFVPGT